MSVRDPWLFRVVAQMQSFAGAFAFHADERDARQLALHLAVSLPHPPDRTHNMFLSTLLLGVAGRISWTMHVVLHRSDGCECGRLTDETLRTFLNWQSGDARVAFAEWASRYFHAFSTSHPLHAADRAARLLRASPQQAWALKVLARTVQTSPSQLRASFVGRFGLTPHAYLHTVRIVEAIALLGGRETTTAAARATGYRSRKDLYRVFRQIARTDLATFGRMDAAQRRQLADRLKARLRPRTDY